MASAERLPSSTAAATNTPTHGLPADNKIEAAAAAAAADPPSDQGNVQNDTKLGGYRLYAVAVGVIFGSLMMSIDISIIGTAIPSIMSEFGDLSQLAWYPAAYTFAVCALTPLAGKMAVVFPLNWVYLSFSGIFLIGSIVCGCAPTSNAFIAGRAVSGVGAAGVASNGMTILVTISDFKKKTLFVGLAAACFGIGLVLGPVLGGVFTERLTWRWCFWINLPFIAVTFTVILLFFKPPKSRQETMVARILSLDLVGCAIFVPAIFMLLLALQRGGQENPWSSATIIGLFVGSGVTMVIFVAWEWYKGDEAMIPRQAVMRRTVVFTCLFAFCHMGSLGLAPYYLPEWFQVVEGVDPLQSGVRMLPTVITQILATMTSGRLALRLKYYNYWFILAPIFMCISSALYTQFTAFSTPPSHWIGFQVIQGIGAGFGMQMSSLAVQLELMDNPELVPVGIALVTFTQYLGSTVLQVIAGTIFTNGLVQQLMWHAGLTAEQTSLLLSGEITKVRDITEQNFPKLLNPILESYNSAITTVFFVPVAGTIAAFFLAFGIKWNKIPDAEEPRTEMQITEADSERNKKEFDG